MNYEQENLPFGLQINKNLELFVWKNSNPNECVQIQHKQLPSYHVLMFFTYTVSPQLELTLMLQKTNRIYFSSKSREICPKQYYFTQPIASQTIGLWYFFVRIMHSALYLYSWTCSRLCQKAMNWILFEHKQGFFF
jgi:hypothetical protein